MNNDIEQIKRNAKSIVASAAAAGMLRAPGQPTAIKLPAAPAAAELGAVRCQFVLVTPEVAKGWLHNNVKNRKLREDTVASYANDMRSGNWLITHQGVAFNDKNELIDGQHRLNGVVRSDTSVTMLVTFGLPSKLLGKKITVMDTVDRGNVRTLGDQLSIEHDIKDANLVAGICKSLAKLCMDGDGARRARKLSVSQTLEICSIYKEQITFAVKYRPTVNCLRTAGVVGAAAFAHAVHPGKIAGYYSQLATGENLTSDSPVLALRNRLMTSRVAALKGSMKSPISEMVLQSFYYCVVEKQNLPQLNFNSALRGGIEYFSAHQQEKIAAVKKLVELPAEKKSDSPVASSASAPAPASPKKLTMEDILRAVERAYGIAQPIILGRGLEQDICAARNAFITLSLDAGIGADSISVTIKRPIAFVGEAREWLRVYHKTHTKQQSIFDSLRAKTHRQ